MYVMVGFSLPNGPNYHHHNNKNNNNIHPYHYIKSVNRRYEVNTIASRIFKFTEQCLKSPKEDKTLFH